MKTQLREEDGWSQKDQNLFANTDALGKCRVGSTKGGKAFSRRTDLNSYRIKRLVTHGMPGNKENEEI